MNSELSIVGHSVCAANTAAAAKIDLPKGDIMRISVNNVANGTGAWCRIGTIDVAAAAVGTASTAASQSLTLTGQATDGQTVTIGSTVYTWKTTLSSAPTVAYEVLRGVDAAASVANLVKAINDSGTIGTHYSLGTARHPTVTAIDDTGDVVTVTAKTPGSAGNSIATTDNSSNMGWASTTLANGADGVETSFYVHPSYPVYVKVDPSQTHISCIGVGANAVVSILGLSR